MFEADVLVNVVGACVDRERWRRGAAQDLDFAVTDFDLACRQVIVDRSLGAHANGACDFEHVLAADVDIVVDNALNDARMVA